MRLRVLIVVTHLLGVGHLARSTLIAQALLEAGADVKLISGGMPAQINAPDGMNFVQLPGVYCKGSDFNSLFGKDGLIVSDKYRQTRQAKIVSELFLFEPHVVITELFPFGRRMLSSEFMALIEASGRQRSPPKLICSIRDILHPPQSRSRIIETSNLINRYYDGILVHSDRSIVSLDASWPSLQAISKRIEYTGFVAKNPRNEVRIRDIDVLCSGGGSSVSLTLLKTAVKAATEDSDALRWHILVPHSVSDADFKGMMDLASGRRNIVVERNRLDFPSLLARSRVGVSQAGYNTVCDFLSSGTRALVVPFDDGGQLEQSLRARLLEENGFAIAENPSNLNSTTLLSRVKHILAMPTWPVFDRQMLKGAETTARCVFFAAGFDMERKP